MLYLQIFIVGLLLFLHLNNVIAQVFTNFVEEFGYTSSTFFLWEDGEGPSASLEQKIFIANYISQRNKFGLA